MRAEVEAPFRTFRIFLLGFFAISAALGTLFAAPALIGSVAHGPNAIPVEEALQTLGIDMGMSNSSCVCSICLHGRTNSPRLPRRGEATHRSGCSTAAPPSGMLTSNAAPGGGGGGGFEATRWCNRRGTPRCMHGASHQLVPDSPYVCVQVAC